MNFEDIKRLCPEFADLELQPYLDDDALENVTDCVIGCQGLDNDAELMAEFIDLYAKAQTAKALAEARQVLEPFAELRTEVERYKEDIDKCKKAIAVVMGPDYPENKLYHALIDLIGNFSFQKVFCEKAEAQVAVLGGLLYRVVKWEDTYPVDRIYSPSEIVSIAEEMRQIVEEARIIIKDIQATADAKTFIKDIQAMDDTKASKT